VSLLKELREAFTLDEEVLQVAAIAAGAVSASEIGNRLLRPAIQTPTRVDDNLTFAGIAAIGVIFASTAGVVRKIGVGMVSWGVGKLVWRNLIRPAMESSIRTPARFA